MILTHPHFLWLLIMAPVIAWMGYRSHAGNGLGLVVALFRFLCMTALVLALCQPIVESSSHQPTHVMLVDLNPDLPDAAIAQASRLIEQLRDHVDGDFCVIVFSNRAEKLSDLSIFHRPGDLSDLRRRLSEPLWSDDSVKGGSSLQDALQLAGAQIPVDGPGDIRLFSNGCVTHGDAEAEAYRLAQRGISILVTPADVDRRELPTALLRSLNTVASARVGQTIGVQLKIESTATTAVTGTIFENGIVAGTASHMLQPGENNFTIQVPVTTAGLVSLSASLAFDGGHPDPSTSPMAAVCVEPASRVLLVQDETDHTTAQALGAILGNSVELDTVSPAALTGRSLKDESAIVLADTPADTLSADAQAQIKQAVSDGTGLLVTGAARSFGPGGYGDSALADVIPVNMSQDMETIDPSTTLVLIIDTSGSMGGERIDLAKEIARLAISHLKPIDKVGIVEFYGGQHWAVPIQSAENASIINRAINRLVSGGGTVLYPAIEEAAFALRNVESRSKHVLVISDGGVEEAPFGPLVRRMAQDGVCVSTAQVMPDDTGSQMSDIARWGHGRFYVVPDPYVLPDLSFTQPRMSLLSPFVFSPSPVKSGSDPLVQNDRTTDWAAIDGYVRTSAKETADILLETQSNDPLLVRWRYGNGFVAAMPTQLGSSMTKSLQDQPQFAQLMAALFRQISGHLISELQVIPLIRPAGVEVAVNTVAHNSQLDIATLNLDLLDSAGQLIRTIKSQPTAPGEWNILLPGLTSGIYRLVAQAGVLSSGTAAFAITPPKPGTALTTNTKLLDRLESFVPLANERAKSLPKSYQTFFELQKYLSIIAISLLLINVTIRRWPAVSRIVRQ